MRGARPKFGKALSGSDHTKLWRLRKSGVVTSETSQEDILKLLRQPRPSGKRARFPGMTDAERKRLVRKLKKPIREITPEEIGSLDHGTRH